MKRILNKFSYPRNNIKGFEIFDEFLMVFKNGEIKNISFLDFQFNEIYSFESNLIGGGWVINNFFVSHLWLQKIEIINLLDYTHKVIQGKWSYFYFTNNYLFFNNKEDNFCYSFNPNEGLPQKLFKIIEEDFLSYPKFVVTDLGIGYSKPNEIRLLNIKDGSLLWSYNIKDYFKTPSKILEGRVLVVEDRIIFFAHTEDWENYATFVLDAQTGELINNPQETIFGGKMYLFDNIIWQKKDKGFAKMNPITLEITHYDLSKELPTEKIEDITMAYHHGLIAVSAKPETSSVRSLVIIFNTKTGKIVWKKEILKDENKATNNENRCQIQDIQMNEKFLAVLVAGNVLYIFEKEKTV